MKLGKDQIETIKKFIHSRGFKHIEVEMEILDHVASSIEEKLTKNPNLSIEKAIHEVHASFGVFGFATIEEEKQKYFHMILMKEFGRNLRKTLLLKKPMINLSIILGILLGLSFLTEFNTLAFSFLSLIFPIAIASGVFIKSYQKFKKWKGRSLMLVTSASIFYVFTFTTGQFTSTVFQDIAETNLQAATIFLGVSLYISLICAVAVNKTMQWGYEWTYERYLKFAD